MAGSNLTNPSSFNTGRLDAGKNTPQTKGNIPSDHPPSVPEFSAQRILCDFNTIQKANPKLSPQECRHILDTTYTGILDDIVSKASQDQSPNSVTTLDTFTESGGNVSSLPLVRTESCPLPQRDVARLQLMKRQLSALPSSTLNANGAFAPQLQLDHQGHFFLPDHLVQHQAGPVFSQTVSEINLSTTCAPPLEAGGSLIAHSSIAGYINQDPREDPFSSIRGWPPQNLGGFSAPARLCINGGEQLDVGPYAHMHMMADPRMVLGGCASSPQAPPMELMPSQSSYMDTISIATEPHGEPMVFEFDETDMGAGTLMQQSGTQGLSPIPLPSTAFSISSARSNEELNQGISAAVSSNTHTHITANHLFHDLLTPQTYQHSHKPPVDPYAPSALDIQYEPRFVPETASDVASTASLMGRQRSTSNASSTARSSIGHMQAISSAKPQYPRGMVEDLIGGDTENHDEPASLVRKRARDLVETTGHEWAGGAVSQASVGEAKKRRQDLEGTSWGTIVGSSSKPGITSNIKSPLPSQATMRPMLARIGVKRARGSTNAYTNRYPRRRDCRVYCQHCNEFPRGFRGEHERRRHYDRAHSEKKKVWVTVDISPNKDFFGNCKPCREGRRYGVDYNAAAHLRRQHFCKEGRGGRGRKEREAAKQANIDKVKEKLKEWDIPWWFDDVEPGARGSKTDPEIFSLRFLRSWLKEIEVGGDSEESESAATEEKAAEYEEAEGEGELEKEPSFPASAPLPITESKHTGLAEEPSSISPTCHLVKAMSFGINYYPEGYPEGIQHVSAPLIPFDGRFPSSSLGYHTTHDPVLVALASESESPLTPRVPHPTGFLGG